MKQAVRAAKEYLQTQAFSFRGMVEQLQYDGFTHAQAVCTARERRDSDEARREAPRTARCGRPGAARKGRLGPPPAVAGRRVDPRLRERSGMSPECALQATYDREHPRSAGRRRNRPCWLVGPALRRFAEVSLDDAEEHWRAS